MNDKLPPHSFESEQGVIGSCFIDPQNCIPEAQIGLTAEHFYDLRCRVLWDLFTGMTAAEVNTATITQRLREEGTLEQIGGISFVLACQDAAPSTANLPVWIAELVEKFTLRQTISRCQNFAKRAQEIPPNVTLFIDELERDMLSIRPNQRAEGDVKSIIRESINKIQERYENPGRIMGFSTGLPDLDDLTDGIHGGEMIVIAGYPSTGKTALAMQVAFTAALIGVPVGIFTAEMLPVQLMIRALCSEARANGKKLEERDIARLIPKAGLFSKSPIHIERASGLSIGQIVAMARRLKQRHGIRIIVVDYIGLITGTGDNKEQKTASVSAGCKAMAMELDCAVLALSQLNDDGKMRDSRAVAQDADSVWKLQNDGEWQSQVQPIKLNIEKCRDGETGQVKLTFLKTITRFECVPKVGSDDYPRNY